MRITLVVFVLIGGTMSFGFWSLQQFDNALENLSAASYLAVSPLVREISTATTTPIVATSTLAISEASSTISFNQDDIDPKFQLIFSPKKSSVYVSCTYEISWLASTTIKSLETSLIDTGTSKSAGPVASGISKENIIEDGSQSLKWKIGVVWPGEYFILISNVNGMATDERSQKFVIKEIPKGSNEKEKKNLCKETGGSLL